jgi:lipoyl(octanoyl) transferase
MESVTVYNLHQYQPYTKIFQLQKKLQALRIDNQIGNIVLLLEHSPVISIGRTPGAEAHLLGDLNSLKSQGIEVCSTNRGGDVTYHGPGQLVVYYIISLIDQDLHRFREKLEQTVIELLTKYNIQAHCKPEYPGVWANEEKICALGIYVRKWVTMHGIALNVHSNLSHFEYIVPCGIRDKGVTSLQKIYQDNHLVFHFTMEQIKQDYMKSFSETFQVDITEGDPKRLWEYSEKGKTPGV